MRIHTFQTCLWSAILFVLNVQAQSASFPSNLSTSSLSSSSIYSGSRSIQVSSRVAGQTSSISGARSSVATRSSSVSTVASASSVAIPQLIPLQSSFVTSESSSIQSTVDVIQFQTTLLVTSSATEVVQQFPSTSTYISAAAVTSTTLASSSSLSSTSIPSTTSSPSSSTLSTSATMTTTTMSTASSSSITDRGFLVTTQTLVVIDANGKTLSGPSATGARTSTLMILVTNYPSATIAAATVQPQLVSGSCSAYGIEPGVLLGSIVVSSVLLVLIS